MKNKVSVAVRVRPSLAKGGLTSDQVVRKVSEHHLSLGFINGQPSQARAPMAFDFVFDGKSVQTDIYSGCVQPLVDSVVDGYNATVFAYGQTGSGKTYTMGFAEGKRATRSKLQTGTAAGIAPRVVADICERVTRLREQGQEVRVYASFLEIHNEHIRDLLHEKAAADYRNRWDRVDGNAEEEIEIRENSGGGIVLVGINQVPADTEEAMLALLEAGARRRTTASTRINAASSRSHSIFSIVLEQHAPTLDDETMEELTVSKLHLVDLAGSERVKLSGVKGKRFKELININRGLLSLGNVISALSNGHNHVPYRDSKLTRLLQTSLGGNSKTLMIACLSPDEKDFETSHTTLRYAARARNIKNVAILNKKLVALEKKRQDEADAAIKAEEDAKKTAAEQARQQQQQQQRVVRNAWGDDAGSARVVRRSGEGDAEARLQREIRTLQEELATRREADEVRAAGMQERELKAQEIATLTESVARWQHQAGRTAEHAEYLRVAVESLTHSLRVWFEEERRLESSKEKLLEIRNAYAVLAENEDEKTEPDQAKEEQTAQELRSRFEEQQRRYLEAKALIALQRSELSELIVTYADLPAAVDESVSLAHAAMRMQESKADTKALETSEKKNEILVSENKGLSAQIAQLYEVINQLSKETKKEGARPSTIPVSKKNATPKRPKPFAESITQQDNEHTLMRRHTSQLALRAEEDDGVVMEDVNGDEDEEEEKQVEEAPFPVQRALFDNNERPVTVRDSQEILRDDRVLNTVMSKMRLRPGTPARAPAAKSAEQVRIHELQAEVDRMKKHALSLRQRIQKDEQAQHRSEAKLQKTVADQQKTIASLEKKIQVSRKRLQASTPNHRSAKKKNGFVSSIAPSNSRSKSSAVTKNTAAQKRLAEKQKRLNAEVEAFMERQAAQDKLSLELKRRSDNLKKKEALLAEQQAFEADNAQRSDAAQRKLMGIDTELGQINSTLTHKQVQILRESTRSLKALKATEAAAASNYGSSALLARLQSEVAELKKREKALNMLSDQEKENLFLFLEEKKQMNLLWQERLESAAALEEYESDKIAYLKEILAKDSNQNIHGAPDMSVFVDKLCGFLGDDLTAQPNKDDVGELVRLYIELTIDNKKTQKSLEEVKAKNEELQRERDADLEALEAAQRSQEASRPRTSAGGNKQLVTLQKQNAQLQFTSKKFKMKIRNLLQENESLRSENARLVTQHQATKHELVRQQQQHINTPVPVRMSLDDLQEIAPPSKSNPRTPARGNENNFKQPDMPVLTYSLASTSDMAPTPIYAMSHDKMQSPRFQLAEPKEHLNVQSPAFSDPPIFKRTPKRGVKTPPRL